MSYGQNPSHIASISVSCLWALTFEMPGLLIDVSGSAYPNIGGLGDLLVWRLTEMSCMRLFVSIVVVYFPTSACVVKVALLAFG